MESLELGRQNKHMDGAQQWEIDRRPGDSPDPPGIDNGFFGEMCVRD
jgi:hypothetical protein